MEEHELCRFVAYKERAQSICTQIMDSLGLLRRRHGQNRRTNRQIRLHIPESADKTLDIATHICPA